MKTKEYLKVVTSTLMVILLLFLATATSTYSRKWEQGRDVIEGYVGWENNPDSLNVYIDDSWEGPEKDSVRAAMQRWNDAGSEPKFREVSNADDAQITIEKGELEGDDKGEYVWETNDDGKMTSGKITIASNHNEPPNPLSIKEIVTHELGHALGLADTDEVANPSDVMKASGPTNGSDGGLSAHDSTQMRTAMLCITIPGEESIPKEKAEDLPGGMPFTPGDFGTLIFPLPHPYPLGTETQVEPVENELITVEFANLIGDQLHVGLYFDPDHWSGTFYLDIHLFPPDEPPYNFWGYYFINQNPVPRTTFECPFTNMQEGSTVLVDWINSHTYPHTNPLRATLAVDGNIFYTKRPTGNFHLDLPPGEYFFELFVDDFQGNSASFGMDVIVNPQMPGDLFLRPGDKTYPEPWYAWIGGVNDQTMVQLFASDPDEQIEEVKFYYNTDMTSPDWIWFYTDHSGFSYAAPGPNTVYDGLADGWAGYLPHGLVAQEIAVPLFFKAEIHTGSGMVLEVLSETTLTWDPTPPSAFEQNLEEDFVTDLDYISVTFTPFHDDFDYVVYNVSAKPEVFTKPIPFIEQTEADSMACGPYALAACLKFFANQGYEGIDGGLEIMALAQALKDYVGFDGAKGTYDDSLASGARKWISENGGGFTVTGPLPYSKFNTTQMRDKSEGDSLLNGISQNIIPLFQWDSINESGDTIRYGHFMTLSSVHNTADSGKRRFDFMDPSSGITVWGDIDEETGICTNFDYNYPPDSSKVFSTIMICPTEPSPNPSGGGTITQGPEFPPVELPMPDSGGVVIRTRAVDQDGHKSERDVTGTRVRPATYPPGDTAVHLGGPPFRLKGGLPAGGEYSGPHVDDGWFYPIIEGIHLITYSYTYPMGFVTSCDFTIIVYAMDFGDAPAPYPTLLAQNGARHIIVPGMHLGASIDAEPDGQPDFLAAGDDLNNLQDEDGVKFLNAFVLGETVNIEVAVNGTGYLNAWFDWEANGTWMEPHDHTIIDYTVTTGIYAISIPVPGFALPGMTYARFRFSSNAGISYDGLADDGEVEDYRILIQEPAEHKMHYPQYPKSDGYDVEFWSELADDFMCSTTGPIRFIRFWISYMQNLITPTGSFRIKICEDIPAIPGDPLSYSMPGDTLWARTFQPGDYEEVMMQQSWQSWLNLPYNTGWSQYDHFEWNQISISNIEEPFIQTEEDIYWLVIDFGEHMAAKGWKESAEPQYNDAAVFHDALTGWQRLHRPDDMQYIDFAFIIDDMIPNDLDLQGITVTGGQTECYEAQHTITTGGSGTTFIVQNNAIVYLIAGYNVNMLPGTHFQNGSQVHAYIDLSGEFCTNPKAIVLDEEPLPELLPLEFNDKESFFRVYPNPNTGQFTLELKEVNEQAVISVEIFSLVGEAVMKVELPEMKQYLFDLSARQPGIYLIRVMKGDDVGVEKVIKH